MVIQAWQLRDFINSGHQSASLVDPTTRQIIDHLTRNTFRPARVVSSSLARDQRARSRSTSVDPLSEQQTWPLDWAVDRTSVRSSVRAFQSATTQIRRLFDPPSTGTTPERRASEFGRHSPQSSPARHHSTSQTSADESIRRSKMSEDAAASGSQAQSIDIEAIITNAIARYVRDNPPSQGPAGPPGPQGNPGEPGQNAAAAARDSPRFNAGDVGFFDPFYDGKSSDTAAGIEHAGKDTYFRDVTIFIDRIKDVVRVKGAELRNNLQICLRGEALDWYTCQLTENEKRLLTYGDNVDEWSRALLERFGPTKASGMAILVKERYTLHDAIRHREPREYAMTIIRAAKIAKLGDIHNQLDVIWNGLDVEFQSDVNPPTVETSLNQLLTSMDIRKQQWWTKAARMTKHNVAMPGNQHSSTHRVVNQPQGKGNSSQYNQTRSMPTRPSVNTGFQNSGFQSRQQNPTFPSYQNSQAYNQYQNRPAYQSYPRRDQQPLPALPAQRQITAGPAQGQQQNGYGSRQPYQGSYQSNGAAPYRPGPPFQPSTTTRPPYQQRAYQASIDEHEESQQESQWEDPNSFHNDYQEQGTQGNEDLDDYSSYYDQQDAEPEVNFVDSPRAVHICKHCEKTFNSRNKLFRHLKNECWKAENSSTATPAASSAAISEAPTIIESEILAPPTQGLGTTFRGFQHTKADVRFCPNLKSDSTEICLDPGCPITLGDRVLLSEMVPDFAQRVRKQASPVPVRGYGNKITNATEYIIMDLYFPGTMGEDATCLAKIPIEVHLTDNLKANMLIGTDVLTPNKFVLDCASQTATIGSCRNVKIQARSVVKPHAYIKRVVTNKDLVTLAPGSVMNVPVSYHGTLPDRDFLFEPELPETCHLGHHGGIYAHIVDSTMAFVQAKNATAEPVSLPKHTRLGTIVEYAVDGCYQISYKSADLATCGWRTPERSEKAYSYTASSDEPSPAAIDPSLEHVLPNGVTIYGKDQEAFRVLSTVVTDFEDVFMDTGSTIDIPEEQWMPIPLKPDAKAKSSKVYPLGQKDREVVDATFDKLQQQGKLRFSTQPTPYSWPCFVVWRDTPQGRKGRVVIDIRGLNAITEDDGYPLPLQADIIALIAGYLYISTVDGVAWFHQFNVQRTDRSKLTIVSHRGQEESSVALMGYKGSPPYVQRQTDALLRPLRAFVRAFVDDIIVFSRTLADHESHLRQLFQLLRDKKASLAPTKSFLGFPSVMLLGQRVDSLGMSTAEEKIKAITTLKFPASLRDLESFLGLTGWLRNSIPRYAQRAQPLQERKTSLTQTMTSSILSDQFRQTTASDQASSTSKRQLAGPARKRTSTKLRYDPTPAEVAAFQDLQNAFRSPTFLMHYDRKRRLYVDIDASKVWGFAAMVYHAKGETAMPAKTDVQAILFLSKSINAAERNYWPTELEVAAIVWVVRKIRHLIEASEVPPVVIYTDHSAAVQISRQTTLSTSSTDKLNLRLVRASQYLSGFNLAVRHKAGKANIVPDALSRLQADVEPDEKQAVLESLYGSTVSTLAEQVVPLEVVPVYHTTLVEMNDDFKKRLIAAYAQDSQWNKILDILKDKDGDQPEMPAGFRFRRHNDLIYSTTLDHVGKQRLCIPEAMQREVFELAHDKNFHAGFHTTYARIAPSIFIKGLSKQLQTYLKHCPECQLNQTLRHPTYGELNPIASPAIPFHTIAMDFIVALPFCDGMNVLLTLTCKFTKKKLLIPGFDEWTAADWANAFLIAVTGHDWGMPVVIISDRDSKFMSAFWQAIFAKLGTKLATSTAYHPQSDGQSERTNQTVEIALRFHLTTGTDDWVSILPFLQACLNNSVSSVTGFAPNELAYGFRVRDTLSMLSDLPAEDLNKLRLIKREEADDAIAFANAMAKTRYDSTHKALNLREGSMAYLRLHHGYSIPGVNPKLSNQRVGPFKVLKKVGNLAYQLELPDIMRIHPVISIAQLEPASDQSEDPYQRVHKPPPPVEESQDDVQAKPDLTKDFKPYEVERLLNRRGTGDNVKYLVKWKGYGNQHNVWYPVHALANSQDLIKEYDDRIATDPTRKRRQAAITPQVAKQRGRPRHVAILTPSSSQTNDSNKALLPNPPRRRGRPRKNQISMPAHEPVRTATQISAQAATTRPNQLLLTQ